MADYKTNTTKSMTITISRATTEEFANAYLWEKLPEFRSFIYTKRSPKAGTKNKYVYDSFTVECFLRDFTDYIFCSDDYCSPLHTVYIDQILIPLDELIKVFRENRPLSDLFNSNGKIMYDEGDHFTAYDISRICLPLFHWTSRELKYGVRDRIKVPSDPIYIRKHDDYCFEADPSRIYLPLSSINITKRFLSQEYRPELFNLKNHIFLYGSLPSPIVLKRMYKEELFTIVHGKKILYYLLSDLKAKAFETKPDDIYIKGIIE